MKPASREQIRWGGRVRCGLRARNGSRRAAQHPAFVVFLVLFALLARIVEAADNVTGWWLQVDQRTGTPGSLVLIYEYQGELFGRIMVEFEDNGTVSDTWRTPKERATALAGSPYLAGLDFIYDLRDSGGRDMVGSLIDPNTGNSYDCKLWLDSQGRLVVRGQLRGFLGAILGGEQRWPRYSPAEAPALAATIDDGSITLPDPASLVPVIHRKR